MAIGESILRNESFKKGLDGWFALSGGEPLCKLSLLPRAGDGTMKGPCALLSGRKEGWHGIAQETMLEGGVRYRVAATVRMRGAAEATVVATLQLKDGAGRLLAIRPYRRLGSVQATADKWAELEATVEPQEGAPCAACAYLEGPPGGVDLLVASFSICPLDSAPKPSPTPAPPIPRYGQNIVDNGDFSLGALGWERMGNSVVLTPVPAGDRGGPPGEPASLLTAPGHRLPPVAPSAPWLLGVMSHLKLGPAGGAYLVASRRAATWNGPAQNLTGKVARGTTYAVSAWVKLGEAGSTERAAVNLTLVIDGKTYMNGAATEARRGTWRRCWGSFRLEELPLKEVKIYAQGPAPGVDVCLADVRVEAVQALTEADRARLRARTDEVRQRDVALRFVSPSGAPLPGGHVTVTQAARSFPIGSCLSAHALAADARYGRFFRDHFNFAVFENELKWTWTEASRGKESYRDADALLGFLDENGLPARGHCLFWDNSVPAWVRDLSPAELEDAMARRLSSVLGRYSGRFVNWDLDNEPLHGSFFADRLGPGIYADMFRRSHALDPAAKYLVNEYNVLNGVDPKSTPDKFAELATSLASAGAPIGGLGVQGHLSAPVGRHVAHALDTLAGTGLPIWITELDVAAVDDATRADDLEAVLREAYAHPAVEGIVLWGFWKGGQGGPHGLGMYRKHAHLANADWSVAPAGQRLEALLREWTTRDVTGEIGGDGCFKFRGYPGSYSARVTVAGSVQERTFVVREEREPQTVLISV